MWSEYQTWGSPDKTESQEGRLAELCLKIRSDSDFFLLWKILIQHKLRSEILQNAHISVVGPSFELNTPAVIK